MSLMFHIFHSQTNKILSEKTTFYIRVFSLSLNGNVNYDKLVLNNFTVETLMRSLKVILLVTK